METVWKQASGEAGEQPLSPSGVSAVRKASWLGERMGSVTRSHPGSELDRRTALSRGKNYGDGASEVRSSRRGAEEHALRRRRRSAEARCRREPATLRDVGNHGLEATRDVGARP